jgi:hypothetical protein
VKVFRSSQQLVDANRKRSIARPVKGKVRRDFRPIRDSASSVIWQHCGQILNLLYYLPAHHYCVGVDDAVASEFRLRHRKTNGAYDHS